jgi:hypothetical protein
MPKAHIRKQNRLATAGNLAPGSLGRRLVIAFLAFNLACIFAFGLPPDLLPLEWLRTLLAPYMRATGLNEMWDTFAPSPKSAEQYLKAVVITEKGNTRVYSFPRMEQLSYFDRYRDERYRKFVESVLCKDCSGLWPDIDKEVARRMNDPSDPPIRVILVKFESPIDPKTGAIGDDAHAQPTALAEHSIDPADLIAPNDAKTTSAPEDPQ